MPLRMKIIGSSAFTPWPSKTASKWTSCRLFWNDKSIQIDIGNNYEGKPVDDLVVSHTHFDHIDGLPTLPEGIPIYVPDLSFVPVLQKKLPTADYIVFKTWKDFGGLKIKPFPVLHSTTSKTYGMLIESEGKKIGWISDYFYLPGYKVVFDGLDYLFIGAASMKKKITHKGYGTGQQSIYETLGKIAEMKNPPKKIFLIHFGMAMRPIVIKTRYLQKAYPQLDIDFTFDGQTIIL